MKVSTTVVIILIQYAVSFSCQEHQTAASTYDANTEMISICPNMNYLLKKVITKQHH